MLKRWKTILVTGVVGMALAAPVGAQVAQEPLLNRMNTVAPNLVLTFDTSGSMGLETIYEYGNPDELGPIGPGQDPSNPSRNWGRRSPDINKLYYDPRLRYLPRVGYDGTPESVGTLRTEWEIYFRRGTGPYTTGGSEASIGAYYSPTFVPPASSVVPGSTATYPNVVDNTPATALFPKFINRTDCVTVTTGCTRTEERTNFTIWHRWYKSRALMAQTGIGLAFQPVIDDSIRLGYATIWGLKGNDGALDRGVSSFSGGSNGTKSRFFDWLYGRTFENGTPNLEAVDKVGRYFQRTDSDGPWATIPNPASTRLTTKPDPDGPGALEPSLHHASCRRSFNMLVTDGYWNVSRPTTAGNRDNVGFSISPAVGAPFVYTPSPPYRDSVANTMADLAMHYWGQDLRPDIANRVPTISTPAVQNPSTWQNVSLYAVTLGLLGTLPRTATVVAGLNSGAISWPSPTENQPTTIDDTWHATINGRGELINATNAHEVTDAIKRMLEGIAGTPQTLSGVAVSATFLKNGTRKYKPEYVPGTWHGQLTAVELDGATGNEKMPPVVFWQVERGLDPSGEPISTIPVAASRNIMTWTGAGGAAFTSTSTGLNPELVNFIRGDSSNEMRRGGTFRNRLSRLGDIVNSNPVFVLDNVDLKYESLGLGNYRSFVAAKSARNQGVLFVGANDGMLHGFRDSDGAEVFAYVPRSVVPELYKLAETPMRAHKYFVDGPAVETDAFLNGQWRNLLLGTTGAGAKSVFALDVTNPHNMNASSVLWEVNTATTGFSQLGHVLSDVQAGVLENGQWVAVFGNGVSSTGGSAILYVVDLQNGTLLKEISTGVGVNNGLGAVRLVHNDQRRIVGAYAGDLRGNLWKFDLTGTSSAWRVGLQGSALYAAGTNQPITAAPAVVPHPNGGHMVVFGTGKFFASTDAGPPYSDQRIYGVWDAQPFGPTTVPGQSASFSTLVQRTLTSVSSGSATFTVISAGEITWGSGTTGIRGWYINLPHLGQRVVYPLERLSGTFLLASTLSPESAAPADMCVQTGSGSGWVYLIDAITGSGPTKRALDTNNDGVINEADLVVSGYQDAVDGRPTPIQLQATRDRTRLCIETAQMNCTRIELECGQLGADACPSALNPAIKAREWRQLFMR
jgi:type IV pilus assembly protein PilY1